RKREEIFVSGEDVDESKFIYDNFVQPNNKPIWMNVRKCGRSSLCNSNYKYVLFNNFEGGMIKSGECGVMNPGKGGKLSVVKCSNRRTTNHFICKRTFFIE
ncbi:C-type lectin domain-containing protein, partial [Salmonella sp. s54412]|uniref:C-type lectin domain-containing protein n=1 Tax=Salmonella sp. s54412 TaxID=3160128 RepID=UPI00375466F8